MRTEMLGDARVHDERGHAVSTKELDLAPIEARLKAATPGEWVWERADVETKGMASTRYQHVRSGHVGVADTYHAVPIAIEGWSSLSGYLPPRHGNAADAEFIAAAHQDVPALIAEVRRLRQAARDLVAVIDRDGGQAQAQDVVSDCKRAQTVAHERVAEIERLRAEVAAAQERVEELESAIRTHADSTFECGYCGNSQWCGDDDVVSVLKPPTQKRECTCPEHLPVEPQTGVERDKSTPEADLRFEHEVLRRRVRHIAELTKLCRSDIEIEVFNTACGAFDVALRGTGREGGR